MSPLEVFIKGSGNTTSLVLVDESDLTTLLLRLNVFSNRLFGDMSY